MGSRGHQAEDYGYDKDGYATAHDVLNTVIEEWHSNGTTTAELPGGG